MDIKSFEKKYGKKLLKWKLTKGTQMDALNFEKKHNVKAKEIATKVQTAMNDLRSGIHLINSAHFWEPDSIATGLKLIESAYAILLKLQNKSIAKDPKEGK